MENISDFAKLLIALSFVWTIVECMLFDDKFVKYSNFVYGVVVISIVLSFVIGVKGQDFSFVNQKLDHVGTNNMTYIKSVYEQNYNKILRDEFNDDSISVTLDEEYKIKSIKCDNKDVYDKLMRYIYEYENSGHIKE